MNLSTNTLPQVVVAGQPLPIEISSLSTGLSAAAASYRLVPNASLDVGKWVEILGYRFEIGIGRQLKTYGRNQLWIPAENWAFHFAQAWQAHPFLSLGWQAVADTNSNEVVLLALNNSPYTELTYDLGPNPMLDSISQETGGQAAWELDEPLAVSMELHCTYQRWTTPLDINTVNALPSGTLAKIRTTAVKEGRMRMDLSVLTKALMQNSGPTLPTEWGLHIGAGPMAKVTVNPSTRIALPDEETVLTLPSQEIVVRPGGSYGSYGAEQYYVPAQGLPATSWPMPERIMLLGLPAVELQWCHHLPTMLEQEIQQVQVWAALYYHHQLEPEWVLLANNIADAMMTGLATYGGFALDFGWPMAQLQSIQVEVRMVDIQGNTTTTVNQGTRYRLHDPGAGVWHTLAFMNDLGGTETLHFRQVGTDLVSWVYPACYQTILQACLHATERYVLKQGAENLIENGWQWMPAAWAHGQLHALPTGEWQLTFKSSNL